MRLLATIAIAGMLTMFSLESFGQSRNCLVVPQFEHAMYDKPKTDRPLVEHPDFEQSKFMKPDFSRSSYDRPLIEHPDFEKPKWFDCSPATLRRTQQSALWPGFIPSSPMNATAEAKPATTVSVKAAVPATTIAPTAIVARPVSAFTVKPATPAVSAAKVEAITPAPSPLLGFKPSMNRGGYFYEAPARDCCGSSSAK